MFMSVPLVYHWIVCVIDPISLLERLCLHDNDSACIRNYSGEICCGYASRLHGNGENDSCIRKQKREFSYPVSNRPRVKVNFGSEDDGSSCHRSFVSSPVKFS